MHYETLKAPNEIRDANGDLICEIACDVHLNPGGIDNFDEVIAAMRAAGVRAPR